VASKTSAGREEVFLMVPNRIIPIAKERFLCVLYGKPTVVAISLFQRRVLGTYRETGTLAKMSSNALRLLALGPGYKNQIDEALQELSRTGVLTPISCVIGHGREETQNQPITSLCFPSADRPRQLFRAMDSFLSHIRERGRSVTTVVIDDSESGVTQSAYLSGLRAAAIKSTTELRYADRPTRTNYIRQLAREGIDPKIASFALLGLGHRGAITTGSAQNCILLDTADEHILSVDDDVICRLARHPGFLPHVNIQSHSPAREQWFFRNHAELLEFATWRDNIDLLKEHEQLLGSSLINTLLDLDPLRQEEMTVCPHITKVLLGDTAARVLLTFSGVAGDSGAYASWPWLTAQEPSLSRLLLGKTSMNAALASREILSVARQPTITHDNFFQSMAFGLANNTALPPFLPIGRNQDGVFGTLIQLMAPGSVAHLPIAVLHEPPTKRLTSFPDFRLADLIDATIRRLSPTYRIGSKNLLEMVGRELEYIAYLGPSDFLEQLSEARDVYFQQILTSIDLALATGMNRQKYWLTLLLRFRRQTVTARLSRSALFPLEVQHGTGRSDAVTASRNVLRDTASLLQSWVHMTECARFLAQRGIRISTRL